jgi:hypothetical protein
MGMTSQERARLALSGGQPDHIPLGDFAIDYDTVERILGHETYVRAKARCQIAYWDGRRDEVVQSLVEDTVALYHKLDVYDIINLCAMTLGLVPPGGYHPEAPRRINDTTWEYADGRVLKYSEVTADITMVHDPRQWTRDLSVADDVVGSGPDEPDPSEYELVDAVVDAFGGDRFILGPFPQADEWVQPGGMERSLAEMAEHPEIVHRALDGSLARARAQWEKWKNRGIHGTMNGTDWAYGSGTFMSPAMWRRYCYPALAANAHAAHEAGLLFVQHACGNNWAILEGMIEAGVDCYQSIQATADMDLERVRQAVAGRMALWGGVRVEHLVGGTPDDVRCDVRQAMDVARRGEGRGFVLGSTHSIAVGARYENFMAMLDEFDRLR